MKTIFWGQPTKTNVVKKGEFIVSQYTGGFRWQHGDTVGHLPLYESLNGIGSRKFSVTFTRDSAATVIDNNGAIQDCYAGEARFPNCERIDHADGVDYGAGVPGVQYINHGASEGILIEEQSTNEFLNSHAPATQGITTTAQSYTVSITGTGSITLSGTATGVATEASPLTVTATAGTLTCTVSGTVNTAQVEAKGYATTLIRTAGAAATRLRDDAYVGWPDKLNNDFVMAANAYQQGGRFSAPLEMRDAVGGNALLAIFRSAHDLQVTKWLNGTHHCYSSVLPSAQKHDIKIRASSTQGVHQWVDGVKQTLFIANTDSYIDADRLHIGTRYVGQDPLNGPISDVALYYGDLSDAEVGDLP